MAGKKKVEDPVYPEAPLTISREKFCELLREQIAKGNELLDIDVPMVNQMIGYGNMYDFGFAPHRSNSVKYEESARNNFIAKYNQWNDRNKTIYRTSFAVAESIYFHEYEGHIWNMWGSSDEISDYKKEITRLMNHMQGDIDRADLMKCEVAVEEKIEKAKQTKETMPLSNKIFIVHGHNEEMKQTVARVVTNLGLIPIILHEQANEGRTIIDKFEYNAENIQFAIILLSGDDLAASVKDLEGVKDEEVRNRLEKRARQNVVFEMGYFAGKLGRSKLFYLLQDEVTKPGDLDGLVYTPYDAVGAWKFGLVKELKACGYDVDANKVL